jgi:hypothetical protein
MAMKRVSGPTLGEWAVARGYIWRWLCVVGVFLPLLTILCLCISPSAAFAMSPLLARTITSSPALGPVGAVIVVTGVGVNSPDGTQIDLGYSTNFATCTAATDTQPGVVRNHAFSGWFRWPAGTGSGRTFEVCAAVDGSNNPFFVGTYQVLSPTPPQISLSPAVPDAGKQATVAGTNFLPAGTSVRLVWPAANGLPGALLGVVSSDASGAFSQTIVVPSHAITSTYTIEALAGAGQPPTMSASTTFHVNGIVIVAVPTPTVSLSPTAAPSPAGIANSAVASHTPGGDQVADNGNSAAGKTKLLLSVALVGLVVVVAALIAGIVVVRKQRALAQVISDPPLWSGAPGAPAGGEFVPAPSQAGPQLPFGLGRITRPQRAVSPVVQKEWEPVPFDPGLLEAMRQAQVSLFVTPRPPVNTEVLS